MDTPFHSLVLRVKVATHLEEFFSLLRGFTEHDNLAICGVHLQTNLLNLLSGLKKVPKLTLKTGWLLWKCDLTTS